MCGQEFGLVELITHAEQCDPSKQEDTKLNFHAQQIHDVDEVFDVDGVELTVGGVRMLHESSSAQPVVQVIEHENAGNSRFRWICICFLTVFLSHAA